MELSFVVVFEVCFWQAGLIVNLTWLVASSTGCFGTEHALGAIIHMIFKHSYLTIYTTLISLPNLSQFARISASFSFSSSSGFS